MSDLIDREQAIEEAKKLFEMGDCYCDRASMVGMLNNMPSTEKTGKWIPVTGRKPKVEQLVWLYTEDNAEPYNAFVGYLNEHGWWVECGVNYSEYSPPCIVAWQPLYRPQPYKGE